MRVNDKRCAIIGFVFLVELLAPSKGDCGPQMDVHPSLAPNAYSSPNWPFWVTNALDGLEASSSPIGSSTDPSAYAWVSKIRTHDSIVTSFPSWRGVADPASTFGTAFAGEYGNRLHFGLHVVGNGTQFRLSNLSFSMHSNDPGDTYQDIGDFSSSTDAYSSYCMGIDYGADRMKGTPDDVVITSGPATQLVDELIYVGIGNAADPTYFSCTTGTQQAQIDCTAGIYATNEPVVVTTNYVLINDSMQPLATSSAQVTIDDSTTPVRLQSFDVR